MFLLYFLVISYVLLSISLYMLFPKANVQAVKGLIPGVNFYEWCKIIGKKPITALWLLFPIVNIFTFVGMAVDLARSFGRTSFLVFAAAFIRMFLIEAYVIPTSSMEGSLNVGDYLFCVKGPLWHSYANDNSHVPIVAQYHSGTWF
ncbi:MAG: S26 family signal peptidase [Saprospiraceae bacterium]|nr:S26 family signal peptidase [Saprospiraceae bacterium]